MRVLIRYCLKLIVFWLLFFAVQRMIFLVMGYYKVPDLGLSEFLGVQSHALTMDLSMLSYILALPFLFIILQLFIRPGLEFNWKGIRYFLIAMVILSSLIFIADLGLFPEWGSKMNRKAMAYMAYPDKVMVSSLTAPLFTLSFVFLILVFGSIFILKQFFREKVSVQASLISRTLFSILLIAGLVIGVRGGLQPLPLKKSSVYFSQHNVLNLAALNSSWNFMELLVHQKEPLDNPYPYFDPKEAKAIVSEMHPHDSVHRTSISKVAKPNILMILLESWSGDVIEPLGGELGVTPQFSRWCSEGIFFDKFYSTGFRTEQGQAALLSGFPSQPTTAIMRSFGKFDKLPGLSNELRKDGYYSAYYYSGDLDYANMGKYLHSTGFDLILGEDKVDFEHRTYWGAYDEELFQYNLAHMASIPRPFFSLIMTATSHEPFDAPVTEGFDGGEPADLYRNTVHYTDRVMGEYLNQATTQDWYDNTLIFIVSDHAHRLPKDRARHEIERHHIPFLITGGALREEFKGTVDHRIASHVDFPATVLGQLGLPSDKFTYSKDIFNDSGPTFAVYTFEDGFGYIDSTQSLIYDNQVGETLAVTKGGVPVEDDEEALRKGKAYIQQLMQDYIDF